MPQPVAEVAPTLSVEMCFPRVSVVQAPASHAQAASLAEEAVPCSLQLLAAAVRVAAVLLPLVLLVAVAASVVLRPAAGVEVTATAIEQGLAVRFLACAARLAC